MTYTLQMPWYGRTDTPMNLCHVSTFPPTLCGIATFATDLSAHLLGENNSRCTIVYNGSSATNQQASIRINNWLDYECAANWINQSDIDAAVVQHEFGIYGGSGGEYVVPFLRRLAKPIVTVLHTVPERSTLRQKEILSLIFRLSGKVVVLSDAAKRNLLEISDVRANDIEVILHGIPAVKFDYPASTQIRRELNSAIVFLSFGFMKPKKGIDDSLYAFSKFLKQVPTARFVIIGVQQPQFPKCDGYLNVLRNVIRELDIANNVSLITRSLPIQQVIDYIRAADVGLLNYQDYEQVSSGVLPLMLGCGRPVISTPFAYAKECAVRCDGVLLTDPNRPDEVLGAMYGAWEHRNNIQRLMERTYEQTREWIWPNAAVRFHKIISSTIKRRARARAFKCVKAIDPNGLRARPLRVG